MSDTPADIDSEAAAAEYLYGLAPDEFVGARNALVRQLRAENQRELAAAVGLLRRPTVVAGELNRVLRLDPDLVDDLIATAVALKEGNQRILDGEVADLGELQRIHRRVAATLAGLAERNQPEVQAAVESASLDEDYHDKLRAATFAVEPSPQTGFDLLTPSAAVLSLSEARAKKQAREAKAKGKKKPAKTKSKPKPKAPSSRAEAEADLQAAIKAHALAERRVEAARKAEAKAADRVATIESQLGDARNHLTETATKRATAEEAELRARERLEQAQAAARTSS